MNWSRQMTASLGLRFSSAWRLLALVCAASCLYRVFGESPIPAQTRDLTLSQFLRLVLEQNESLQVRALEVKIADKRFRAERGVFEPELVLNYDRQENRRQNTAQERRAAGDVLFEEKNNDYGSTLEALVPTGAKISLGYTLHDLRNNLQDPTLGTIFTNRSGREFVTFAGVTLTQPLLKNAWFSSTLANIRLAALGGDVAYQEYRRQMMLVITTAEAAYWNLYLAQEQVRFLQDSARLAEGLLQDSQARLQNGKGSELETLEARAALALRRSKLEEARQKLYDTAAQMSALISETSSDVAPLLHATDAPAQPGPVPEFAQSGRTALQLNPDYLGQIKKLQQENIRVAYARNQRLPQLDLKASFGLNGLGPDPGSSWDEMEHGGYPSFTAGVELHVPLGLGIRGRNELDAARLRKQQALLALHDTESQVLSSITASLRKLGSLRGSIQDYEQIVAFNQTLLETQLKRQEVGKTDVQHVLDADAALFDARNSVLEAKVKTERARLELELSEGAVLRSRNLDFSQRDVQERTLRLLQQAGMPAARFKDLLKDAAEASPEPAKPGGEPTAATPPPPPTNPPPTGPFPSKTN